MYKSEPLTRRGSLRSLRSAPLLSTVLESTLSLTRIHPIASLELPGLDYAVHSQSLIGAHHRELGTSLRSGIAAITAASATAAGGISQSQSALLGRYGANASIRHNERKIVQPKRVLSRKLKPHIVADTVKQYISRAQRTTKGSQEQQSNMEFLRGVYAFMQVSRSSVDYSNNYNNGNNNLNGNLNGYGSSNYNSDYDESLNLASNGAARVAITAPDMMTRTTTSTTKTVATTNKGEHRATKTSTTKDTNGLGAERDTAAVIAAAAVTETKIATTAQETSQVFSYKQNKKLKLNQKPKQQKQQQQQHQQGSLTTTNTTATS